MSAFLLLAAAIALPNGTSLAIAPDGRSETVQAELRDAVTLKPDSAYALSYSIRSDSPVHAIAGTDFAELGADEPGGNVWRCRTSVFATPSRGRTFPASLHFGQWLPNGKSEVRDVSVVPLAMRHSVVDGIELGGGERLDGNDYLYSFPFGRDGGNAARPLHRFDCRRHGRLWWFSPKSHVVYRHRVSGRRFTRAGVFVGSSDWSGGDGKVAVEASADGRRWRTVGAVASRTAVDAELPAELFPADEVFIRLSGGEGCTVQIAHYNLKGAVDGARKRIFGRTAFCRDDGSEFAVVENSVFDDESYGMLVASRGGVSVWTADSMRKVTKRHPVPKRKGRGLFVGMAANEAESVQLVVNAGKDLSAVTVTLKERLVCSETGNSLPMSSVDVRRCGYVDVRHPTDFAGLPIAVPDKLLPIDGKRIPVAAGENQPFWVTVRPPKDAGKGTYRGILDVTALRKDGTPLRFPVPLSVEVFGFALPDRMSCETAFGLTASLVAKVHRLKEGSNEHRDVMERYLSAMSECRISPYRPTPFDGWRVTWNGDTPVFDFSDWDREMERVLDRYHFNTFHVWLPGLGFCDITSREEPEFMGVRPGDPRYGRRLGAYVSAIGRHLREKGWQDMAYAYVYDEPRPQDYGLVRDGLGFVAKHAPEIRRMLPALSHSAFAELDGAVSLWCPQIQMLSSPNLAAARARGDRFWWYVCNNPKAPYVCSFIDHPLPELRIWLWQTWKERVSGVLIWDVFNWRGQTDHPDQNGDGRLLYPPESCEAGDGEVVADPAPSVRAVHLRDGIEDYEYFAILRRLDPDNPLLDVPADVLRSLTDFSRQSINLIKAHRIRLAREIELKGGP